MQRYERTRSSRLNASDALLLSKAPLKFKECGYGGYWLHKNAWNVVRKAHLALPSQFESGMARKMRSFYGSLIFMICLLLDFHFQFLLGILLQTIEWSVWVFQGERDKVGDHCTFDLQVRLPIGFRTRHYIRTPRDPIDWKRDLCSFRNQFPQDSNGCNCMHSGKTW